MFNVCPLLSPVAAGLFKTKFNWHKRPRWLSWADVGRRVSLWTQVTSTLRGVPYWSRSTLLWSISCYSSTRYISWAAAKAIHFFRLSSSSVAMGWMSAPFVSSSTPWCTSCCAVGVSSTASEPWVTVETQVCVFDNQLLSCNRRPVSITYHSCTWLWLRSYSSWPSASSWSTDTTTTWVTTNALIFWWHNHCVTFRNGRHSRRSSSGRTVVTTFISILWLFRSTITSKPSKTRHS